MGADYSRQINSQLPIIQDAEINRYINVLGDSIATLSDDRNLEWHFFVVDSKEVNAFAVPGGYIYVNRGLIERTQRMDQLAEKRSTYAVRGAWKSTISTWVPGSITSSGRWGWA